MPIFVIAMSFGNAIVFHGPLLRFAMENLDPLTSGGAMIMATLFVLVFSTTAITLAAAALIHPMLVKMVSILIVSGNAVALYFVHAYRVIPDTTMMGNVLNTDAGEVAALLHSQMIVYLLTFAVLPFTAIASVKISRTRFWVRGVLLISLTVFSVSWIYANGRTWLWFDRHMQSVGALVMPWGYVANTIRFHQKNSVKDIAAKRLPDPHLVHNDDPLVVLVIGEAARAASFSLYGYARATNPALLRYGAAAMPNTTACATYTTAAIKCMLSHSDSPVSAMSRYENLPTYLQRNGISVTWRSNNTGQPPMIVHKFARSEQLRQTCTNLPCDYDSILLHELTDEFNSGSTRPRLFVLHQSGSHGPDYWSKYPPGFDRFRPVCRSVDLQRCTQSDLINAYDNTIVFTDYLLGQLIAMLAALPEQPSVLIYISDHGESLGESGFYLHGTPMAFAPKVQKEIPFIVWMSDEFRKTRGLNYQDIASRRFHSHNNIFHSVMGALGLRSDVYQPSLDIFTKPKSAAD